MPFGLNEDNTLFIEAEFDGITYRCSGFKTVQIAKSNLAAWQETIPNSLEHLLRAVGVRIYWYDNIYKWCGEYEGKLFKTFLGDYGVALKEIKRQWENRS